MFERFFRLQQKGSTVRVEVIGGFPTFLTMAYIIFVNPAVLSVDFAGNPTGLSFEAAMLATCLAASVATILMGLFANFPIGQAPGMGENFFFVSVVMALTAMGVADAWKVALGITLTLIFTDFLRFDPRKSVQCVDEIRGCRPCHQVFPNFAGSIFGTRTWKMSRATM